MSRDKLTTDVITNRTTGIVTNPETGEDYEAVYRDIGESERQELERLEEQAEDGDEDAAQELPAKIIDEYLIEPDLDADDVGVAWKQALMVGFLRGLGDNKAVESANEFFDSVEESGNR